MVSVNAMTLKREFLFTGAFDGFWHPGFLDGVEASAGREWGNAEALADLLGLHLGVAAPRRHLLERIVEAQTGIRAYCDLNPDAYFAESFRRDDLGVAHRLLMMRDALLMGGWEGDEKDLPARPSEVMAALGKCADPGNLAGLPDRLNAIIALLGKRPRRVFDTVFLARDMSAEPLLVRRLIEALAATGTAVAPWTVVTPAAGKGESDLERARRKVETGENFTPRGDGSLLLLQGDNAYDSAEALAAWLAAARPEEAVVIADGESRPMLDAAFRRYHLPAIGAVSISPYRSALQAIRLAFTLRWKPFDPARLLEFLQLPISPIPRRAGYLLAGALAEAPGTGSAAWRNAIIKSAESENDEGKAEALRERLAFWLPDTGALLDPGEEMPIKQVCDICVAFAGWARKRSRAMKGDDARSSPGDSETILILEMVATEAERLGELVRQYGTEGMGFVSLSSLIDRVAGDGIGITLSPAQEGSMPSVGVPSALLGPSDTVIWWNFTRSGGESFPYRNFTDEERSLLAERGIEIQGPGDHSLAVSREWRRPLECASGKLILVAAETELGEPRAAHPLWDEITAGWKPAEKGRVTLHTEDLLDADCGYFPVEREIASPLELPGPCPVFHLDNVRPALREKESATSLELLAGCPLAYVLQYQARMAGAVAIKLADDTVVRGNVGHRVIQEVFGSGKTPGTREEAERLASAAFDRLVASEGATLLLPGKEADLASFRGAMVRVAGVFREIMSAQGLSVAGVEKELAADTEIGLVGGRIDILLEDLEKNRLVIDMKYSEKGEARYSAKLEKDEAIQLAVYSRTAGKAVPVAYLSLKDAALVTNAHGGFPGARPAGNSDIFDTWHRLVATVRHYLERQFMKKEIYAFAVAANAGVLPDDVMAPGGIEMSSPCRYCDYGVLCGMSWNGGGGGS